jgi:hypothetical protein
MESKLSAINQENLSTNMASTNPKKRKQPPTPTDSEGELVVVQGPKPKKLRVARTYASP